MLALVLITQTALSIDPSRLEWHMRLVGSFGTFRCHRELSMEAVQFHPESILTLEGDCGLKLMANVVARAALLCRAGP